MFALAFQHQPHSDYDVKADEMLRTLRAPDRRMARSSVRPSVRPCVCVCVLLPSLSLSYAHTEQLRHDHEDTTCSSWEMCARSRE